MAISDLNKGDQKDLHIKLYQRELQILDRLAAVNRTSRSAIVGGLLRDYAERETK